LQNIAEQHFNILVKYSRPQRVLRVYQLYYYIVSCICGTFTGICSVPQPRRRQRADVSDPIRWELFTAKERGDRKPTGRFQADVGKLFLYLNKQNCTDIMRYIHQDKTLLAFHFKSKAFIRIYHRRLVVSCM